LVLYRLYFIIRSYTLTPPLKEPIYKTKTLNNIFNLTKFRSLESVSYFYLKGKRYYSTELGNNISNKNSYIFKSLACFRRPAAGYEEIKNYLLGVAGVYKLINKEDPARFYIGSSVNLSRRINEYLNLTKGLRFPKSNSEIEI